MPELNLPVRKYDAFLKFIFLFFLAAVVGRIYEFDLTLSTGSLNYLKHFPTSIYTLIFAFPYGVAGLLLYLTATILEKSAFFRRWKVLQILICVLVVDLVELLAGLVTLKFLGVMPWDYSHHFLNYMGLISLPITVRWTLFVVLLGAFAFGPAKRFISEPLPDRIRKVTVGVLMFYPAYLIVIILLKRFASL